MLRTAVARVPMALAPTLLVAAVAVGLVGATRAPSADGSSGGPAAPAAVQADRACITDDLTGTVVGLSRRSGVRDAVLQLTNNSGRTCRVRGRVDIALVTPPGELVRVPTSRIGHSGGDAGMTVSPGATAWSRVQWDQCDAGRDGCGVGVALQFLVDRESAGTIADLIALPEADEPGITMRALRIGPLHRTRAAALR